MRLTYILALLLSSFVAGAQTNQTPPAGSVPLADQLYIAPDSTVWTWNEFEGLFVKVAKWNSVDSTLAWTESIAKATKPGYRFTVMPNTDGDDDTIGPTGLSYKYDTDEYVISYHANTKASKLWFFARNSNNLLNYSTVGTLQPIPDRELDVTPYIDIIQGNVWDSVASVYWILGTQKGVSPADNARVLIAVDDSGNLIETYSLTGVINAQMGQIAINGDILIIKPNNSATVYFMDKNTKSIVRTQTAHTTKEGLAYDGARDLVWIAGDEGIAVAYDYTTWLEMARFPFQTLRNENPSGNIWNVEGTLIDPIDDKMVMAFDGYLHGDNNNGNAMFKFDFPRYTNRNPSRIHANTTDAIAQGNTLIRATNSNVPGNLFSVTNYGQLAGRVWSASTSQLAGGYAIETNRTDSTGVGFRFAQFNVSDQNIGNVMLESKRNMDGFIFSKILNTNVPAGRTEVFNLDYSSGAIFAPQTTANTFDTVSAKALITREYAAARYAGISNTVNLTGNQSVGGLKSFTAAMTVTPPSTQTTSVSARQIELTGATGGSYIRIGRPSAAENSAVLRGFASSGIQLSLYDGGMEAAGAVISTQYRLSALNTAPANASATGTTGEIRIDANYIYICTATNTWKRVAISTW